MLSHVHTSGNDLFLECQVVINNRMVRDYSYEHFHDKWECKGFGYRHRDGSLAQTARRNLFMTFSFARVKWHWRGVL